MATTSWAGWPRRQFLLEPCADAVILLAAWFLLGMGAAWVGVTRLASLERAKFVLELAVEQAAARATPEPLEPYAPAGAAATRPSGGRNPGQ